MKKLGLLVVAVAALAAVALIPTDASALVVCWAVAGPNFNESVCMEVTLGATAIALQGFYQSAVSCNGTATIPAQGTVIPDGSGFSLGIVVDFAAPAGGGNGAGCFQDTQHVVLTVPSLGGAGSHRNIAGTTGPITYTLSSISANETLSDVQARMAGTSSGTSSAGSP